LPIIVPLISTPLTGYGNYALKPWRSLLKTLDCLLVALRQKAGRFRDDTPIYKAKANKATAEAKIEYHSIAEGLQRKQEEARTKLQELRAASDDAWEELKAGGENAWTELKTAFHGAAAKFK
jgi:hypothetical protein